MRTSVDPTWWVSGTWQGRPIGEALGRRDIATIFNFLHGRGLSYGTIGAIAGLSPARTAEIAKRVRQVTAYDVLERIAVGFDIPRAAMGLGLPTSTGGRPAGGTAVPERQVGPVVDQHQEGFDLGDGLDRLQRVRASLDEALASSTVSPRQMELIEESVAVHVQTYPATAPRMMLSRLAGECDEIQRLSRRRQPATVQSRLSGAAALLATMCADAFMRLGTVDQARLWYRTALLAADDSGQQRLQILVRAQAAMLPYYFGNPAQTVSLADAALAFSASACPSAALATAAKARAFARQGAADEARTAIDDAQRLFDRVGDIDTDEAFRFTAKRLLLYQSGTATWLGDTATAYRVQDAALRLYQTSTPSLVDPALIQLDRAVCLVQDRRMAEASTIARHALAELPRAQRTELVLSRARDVLETMPPRQRCPEAAQLAAYLEACADQVRTLTAEPVAADP